MSTLDPSIPERREALVSAAQRLTAEAGPEAGALLDPELASAIAAGLSYDIGLAIEQRTATASTLDGLVDGLVDGVLEAAAPWQEALQLANVAVERVADFEHWSDLLGPWLDAVESALAAGQERGIVRDDVEPRATALVLRDALDRAAKIELRFKRDGYRDATAALVRGALAPDEAESVTG
jgi:hypothetical protein